ncbi:permease [Blastococcus sp. VKM Ac-2987]|uniref:permease n=1 Tax=Blastococcus sp. VKM Ac-2987 TaxID=3004141 RepID=UPI0022AB8773|nr:permease [Blastococcus sp. VKM Ac-2987]MCZ2857073.1 permease [Blastococcus sp. VKM Ac-2987]
MTEGRARIDSGSGADARTEGATTPVGTTEGATRVAAAPRVDHDDDHVGRPTQVSVAPTRRDRVRWGPVWAGLVVAIPTFLLLQLATLALGLWDVGAGEGNNADLWSSINGLVALFLGGLTAAATAIWRGISDGLLHGILVWALTIVSLLLLTLFGGGALLGSLAGAVTDIAGIQQSDIPDIQAGEAADAARSAASWAVLGLGLSIAAAALGGVLGAKMWPSKHDDEDERVAVR